MNKIIEVIKSLPNVDGYKPASQTEITDAENLLGIQFADDYKEYLAEFGEVSAQGIELTGIIDADYINVVDVTKEQWKLNPSVKRDLYVIEEAHIDGIIFWQDSEGFVYQTVPNSKPTRIADSLAEYLLSRTESNQTGSYPIENYSQKAEETMLVSEKENTGFNSRT